MYSWEIQLSVDIFILSTIYVVCHSHENSISIMSINFSSWFCFPLALNKWIITLWGSNKLCAYYKPRKCEHMRFCHLELILLVILFLCGMLLKQVSIYLNAFCLSLFWILFVEDVLGMAFPNMFSCIFWEANCFKLLLGVALHLRMICEAIKNIYLSKHSL